MTIGDNLENRYKLALLRLPGHMRDGMRAYIETGQSVGDFLTLMIQGQSIGALAHADPVNRNNMGVWRDFFELYAPPECHGSVEKMKAWQKRGGLNGK